MTRTVATLLGLLLLAALLLIGARWVRGNTLVIVPITIKPTERQIGDLVVETHWLTGERRVCWIWQVTDPLLLLGKGKTFPYQWHCDKWR